MGNSCSGSPEGGSGRDLGNSCFAGASSSVLGKIHDPDFKWKVYSFSSLLEKGTIPAYSDFFHCRGYKWYLQMTPMNKKSGAGIPYVALSLCLNQNNLKEGYTIKAVFEISMYNHSNGTYCGYQASSYSFKFKKNISGTMCLIPLEELLESSDFIVDDSCIFGVRVIKAGVTSPEKNLFVAREESITVQNLFLQKKELNKGTYTWTLNSFLKPGLVLSPLFDVAGHKWCIAVYPLGNVLSTKSLSMYLYRQGSNELPPGSGMMIELTLSILDQKHGKQHFTRQARLVFTGKNTWAWGWSNFIPLKTLKDPSRGYLVGSDCIVKADITIIGSTKDA